MAGVSVQTAGVILMVAGALGLLVSLFLHFSDRERSREVVREPEPVVRERRD